jgi:LysM repeat protein
MRSRIFSLMFVLLALFAVTFSASAQRLCETLVEDALDDTDDNCDLTQPNDACYGFDTLDSYFFTEGDFEFRSPADLIRLGELHTVHSQPLDLESDEWGVGYFEMKATLHTQTDEAVNVLMLGDVAMENAVEPEDITEFEVFGVTTASDVTPQRGFVDGSAQFANSIASGTTLDADALSPDEQWVRVAVNNETAWIPITALADAVVVEDLVSLGDEGVRNAMQDIFFTTGGISDCTDAPNTVVIQGPEEGDFELTVNGVPMRASSTLIFGIENPFDEYQRMFATVLEGELVVNVGMPDEMVIPEGYYSTVRLTNNAGLNPGQDALLAGNLVPVTNRITGEVILGPLGRPFYRHVPIEPFTTPQPLTFDGFDYRGWGYYRFMRFLDGLLNYAVVIPEPQIVEPECVPDTAFFDNPYVIQPGDTIYGLAQEYGAFTNDIVAANCIDNPALIVPGQIINLPPAPATPEPVPPVEIVEEPVAPPEPAEQTGPVAGVPASIGTVGVPPTNAVANSAFGTLQVQILDGLGDPVVGVPVTFSVNDDIASAPYMPRYTRQFDAWGWGNRLSMPLPFGGHVLMPVMRNLAPNYAPNMNCGFEGTYGGYFPSCQTSVNVTTDASGIATSPSLTAEIGAGNFTVTASGGGFNQTFNLTVDPDVVDFVVLVEDISLSGSPTDTEWRAADTFTVNTNDQWGNPVGNESVYITTLGVGSGEVSVDGGTTWVTSANLTTDADGEAMLMYRSTNLGNYTIDACPGVGSCTGTLTTMYGNGILASDCPVNPTTGLELEQALDDTYFCQTTTITLNGATNYPISDYQLFGAVTINGNNATVSDDGGTGDGVPALLYAFKSACITVNNVVFDGINRSSIIFNNGGAGWPGTMGGGSAVECGTTTLNNVTAQNGTFQSAFTGAEISLSNSTISNNTFTSSLLYSTTPSQPFSVSNTTVINNTGSTANAGRAIDNGSSNMTLTGVTFTGNTSPDLTLATSFDVIYHRGNNINMNNVTINTHPGTGINVAEGGTFTLNNVNITGQGGNAIRLGDTVTRITADVIATISNSTFNSNVSHSIFMACLDVNLTLNFSGTNVSQNNGGWGLLVNGDGSTTCQVNGNSNVSYSGNVGGSSGATGNAVINP